jgi:hypothetical protein
MTTTRAVACATLIWLSLSGTPCRGETFAVVVGGISKDANDRAAQDKTLADLQKYLSTRAKSVQAASTASSVKDAFDKLAAAAGPQDRLVFWYVGQANAVGGKLRFNLPGPDITHEDLAALLARIKAGTILVVLDCPNAAMAVKMLSSPGRVIVCASTQDQSYGTQFSRHFVPALLASESDADKDGRVSILEAFAAAARRIEQWYRDKQILPTETPCLDDNGDGTASERPWSRAESADGVVASKLFLDL